MDRKLFSVAGQTVYSLRKAIVEPLFDQIKGAKQLDRFRLQGVVQVIRE